MTRSARGVLLVVGTYVVVGVLWITFSTMIGAALFADAAEIERFETLKGWAFVLVTGATLYFLLRARERALAGAHAAVKEREAFYRRLLEHTGDVILLLEADGRIAWASPSLEKVTGVRAEDAVGSDALGFVHPEDFPRVWSAFRELVEHDHASLSAEYRVQHRDGSVRTVSSLGRKVPGSPTRVIINTRDRSEQQAVEQQLRQAQKFEAIGQFTAGIVHDFNNILSVVMANAQLLLADLPESQASEREEARQIKDAAWSGADMVRKLLGFSRRADLRIGPIDARHVLAELVTMLRHVLPGNIAVRTAVAPGTPLVLADAGALQQVVINLATNARDAMRGGGTLTITLEPADLNDPYLASHPWVQPGQYVRLEVRDTGGGMDAATLARVYEPFFTTKPPGSGTGLGMPMVFGLVKQHNGYVDITSRPGEGTAVHVFLPAAPAGSAEPVPAAPSRAQAGTECVMIVDDEEPLRRASKRLLEKFGYTVLLAGDGAECLEQLARDPAAVDAVLSDLHMPVLDGVGLYHEMRRRGYAHPFILMSGEPHKEFRDRYALDVPFVRKPWEIEELVAALRAALDRRS